MQNTYLHRDPKTQVLTQKEYISTQRPQNKVTNTEYMCFYAETTEYPSTQTTQKTWLGALKASQTTMPDLAKRHKLRFGTGAFGHNRIISTRVYEVQEVMSSRPHGRRSKGRHTV